MKLQNLNSILDSGPLSFPVCPPLTGLGPDEVDELPGLPAGLAPR